MEFTRSMLRWGDRPQPALEAVSTAHQAAVVPAKSRLDVGLAPSPLVSDTPGQRHPRPPTVLGPWAADRTRDPLEWTRCPASWRTARV